MKKDGRDKLLERVGETGESVASKAKPSRKPPKTAAAVASVRKRVLPLLGVGSIQIIDMRAVLK